MRNAIFALCAALVAFAAWNIYSLARLPPAVRSAVGDLKDPKAEVRWTAAEKLEKLGPQAKGAQPALIAALNDPEPNGLVALSAAKALVAIGADPDVAIPALVKLLETDRGNAPVWAGRCLILMPGGMEALLNVVRTTNMRETPTHALASFGAEGLPRLEGLLADGDPTIRSVAVTAASRVGVQSVPVLINAMRHKDPKTREEAIVALREFGAGSREATPQLVKALADSEVEVRAAATATLGEIGAAASAAVPALSKAMSDPDPTVRDLAATHIIRIDPSTKSAALATLAALIKEDEAERVNVAQTLADFGAEGVPLLRTLLKNSDAEVRANAILSLGMIGPAAGSAVPDLIDLLDAPAMEADPKGSVLGALFRIGPAAKAALPSISRLVDDPDVGSIAIEALGGLGPEAAPAVPKILEAMKRDATGLGSIGPTTLGEIGPGAKEAVPVLIEWMSHDESGARCAAAIALGKIGLGSEKVVAELVKVLQTDRDLEAARAAAESLGKLGPGAKSALPDLIEFLAKDDERAVVNWAVALAVVDLDPAQGKAVAKTLGGATRLAEGEEFARIKAALVKLGPDADPAIGEFADLLDHWDIGTGERLSDLLVALAPVCPSAIEPLTQCLGSSNATIRERAAKALRDLGRVP